MQAAVLDRGLHWGILQWRVQATQSSLTYCFWPLSGGSPSRSPAASYGLTHRWPLCLSPACPFLQVDNRLTEHLQRSQRLAAGLDESVLYMKHHIAEEVAGLREVASADPHLDGGLRKIVEIMEQHTASLQGFG